MSSFTANEDYETIVGIDLGTTFSCISAYNPTEKKVEVIPLAQGRTMPSWVAFTPEGKTVGHPAKSQVASNPNNTVYDVKRFIGRPFNDEIVKEECKGFPFKVVDGGNGDPRVEVEWRGATKQLAPEEISSFVLAELKQAAEKHLGKEVKSAVITVPAHFNNQQRQATKDAGRIAGLNVRRIINEPTAAALAYGLHNADEEKAGKEKTDKSNVDIFDLGGGTFDVTCLTMNGGVFEVKATGGDTHLGGEDFDNLVVEWCKTQILEKHGKEKAALFDKSNRAMSRLRRACETAKRALSSGTTTNIEVDSLVEDVDFNVALSRAKFEELNAKLFQDCLDTVTAVLKDAGVKNSEVTDIVLVGGSTRVPILQTKLGEMFSGRIELCKSIHPDEAVAIGAAVQGHILATGGKGGGQDLGVSTDLLLLDVTPLSLGIELEGRVMSTLIKRNTAIPCKKTRTYSTVDDWQTEIDVVVYEGERPHIDGNNKLGSFVISGVQKARAGEPKVDVTFSLDANGILVVSAEDQVTGAKANAEIKAEAGRLTKEEVDKMIADSEKYKEADEELAKKLELKSLLEEAIFECNSMAKEKKDDAGVREIENMMDWLELDSDQANYEDMKKKAISLEDKWGVRII
jgi:L1 cell adhesion molecule like protein